MFGKKEEDLKLTTLIGEGAKLDGNFSVPGSTRIDGQIDGNVSVEGTLIVGVSGKINGDVSTETLILGGEVQGNISASKRAELTNTAKVMGDIQTAVIVIDENAVFQGKCNVGSENPAANVEETVGSQQTVVSQTQDVSVGATQETAIGVSGE